MLKREWLLAIPELKLAGKADKMTDSQFSAYLQTLNSFIDGFPNQAEQLRDAADDMMYGALTKILSDVCGSLYKLHADNLAQECEKQINELTGANLEKLDQDDVEAFVEQIIQSISALSIDIQMSAHKQSAPAPIAGKHKKANIFAVDNAVMFLNTLKKLLLDHPYEVTCMTSCTDALQYLRDNQPDVILLDIEMPEMNGYELARRIKQSGQKAPIIFITANSAREYVDKAVEVGAVGLLMKPLRVNQLLAKLREFV